MNHLQPPSPRPPTPLSAYALLSHCHHWKGNDNNDNTDNMFQENYSQGRLAVSSEEYENTRGFNTEKTQEAVEALFLRPLRQNTTRHRFYSVLTGENHDTTQHNTTGHDRTRLFTCHAKHLHGYL
ncbi:hypothetical protein E2C01_058466 [Portunus trituberculatus]|uniref:Uncharacterized protein n=1 Tax=Portunus trituberculatus TaxID=210409 RepID=A0A5B7GZV9_PORTR|nr:hypothetical protein [Portunus trituberculatus]